MLFANGNKPGYDKNYGSILILPKVRNYRKKRLEYFIKFIRN